MECYLIYVFLNEFERSKMSAEHNNFGCKTVYVR